MSFDFIYLRKSRLIAERKDPDVLKRHRIILTDLARADGRTIPPEHIFEEVRSGERISRRPQFQKLLEIIEGMSCNFSTENLRPAGALYVMDVDRLSRGSIMERGRIQEALQRAAMILRLPNEIIDLSLRSQRTIFQIKGTLAEDELQQAKDRLAMAEMARMEMGWLRNGCVPYGYRWSKDSEEVSVHPTQFPVLAAIAKDAFHMSIGRLSIKHGVPASTIRNVLRNPTICGWAAVRLGPRPQGEGYRYLPWQEWKWPRKPGGWEAAMEREEFLRLQGVLDSRRWGRGREAADDGWCRDSLRFTAYPDRPPVLGLYKAGNLCYPTYELRKESGSRLVYVDRRVVHEHAGAVLKAVVEDKRFEECCMILARQKRETKRKRSSNGDGAAIAREIAVLRRKLDNLREQQAGETDTEEIASIIRVREKIRGEIAAAEQVLAETRAMPMGDEQLQAALPLLTRVALGHFDEIWEGDRNPRMARLLAQAILKRVWVEVDGPPKKGVRHERRVTIEVHEIWNR